jgi:Domain of Unknown Function (DUF1080)
MIRFLAIYLSIVSLIAPAGRSGGLVDDQLTPQDQREGFVLLFDGKSLTNWHSIPLGDHPAAWRARDGLLGYEPGDSWLASDATYRDFVLRLEYRTGPDSDSGIFLRSTPTGYPSFTGMEIEIKNGPDGAPSPTSNTALYGAAAPIKNVTKAAGGWNTAEISLIGRHLTAVWNGVTIHDLDLDDPAYAGAARGPLSARAREGQIGFQAHLTGAPVEFRNVRIRTVTP